MDIKFEKFLFAQAKKLEDDAGYSGAMNDGGARELREKIAIYKAGEIRIMPREWEGYVENFNRENDPEYAEFVRLKDKFGCHA